VGGERARGSRAGRRAGLYSGLAVFGTVLANKKLLLRVLGERRGAAAAGRRAAAAVLAWALGALAVGLLRSGRWKEKNGSGGEMCARRAASLEGNGWGRRTGRTASALVASCLQQACGGRAQPPVRALGCGSRPCEGGETGGGDGCFSPCRPSEPRRWDQSTTSLLACLVGLLDFA
jgi:hypothetical protein